MRRTMIAGLVMMGVAACGQPAGTAKAKDAGGSKATSSALTLPSGTTIEATTSRTISSKSDKAGGTFSASVTNDVKDSEGRTVIPAGSTIEMSITDIQAAADKGKDGQLVVAVNSATVGGKSYPLDASISAMPHTLKGQGVGAGEVEKTAAGAVIGGIAGRIIGGNSKGTVIGAVAGGAVGAAVAVQSADRDVVVAAGTPIEVTLAGPVTIR